MGFGNFENIGFTPPDTQMMIRTLANGNYIYELLDIHSGGAAGEVANVGLEWQVAGFGDFSGNPKETDMLLRDGNNGDFEWYNFYNRTSAGALGNVGLEWQVLRFWRLFRQSERNRHDHAQRQYRDASPLRHQPQ